MSRRPTLLAFILAFSLGMGALGCGHAFRDAMTQGDAYAQQGNWDGAAASYERAVNLDPDDEEAQVKWMNARKRQAAFRTSRSRLHLSRGEFALAAKSAFEAMRLDPQNAEARAAYADAKAQSMDRANVLINEGKLHEALDLAQALRRLEPQDSRLAELEGRCLDLIASRAYDRAMAYLSNNKKGNALLSLNEAEQARPGYRDVRARLTDVRIQLEDEIRLIIQVVRAPDGERNSLTALLEESLLRWTPEARFRLSAATDQAPREGAQFVRLFPRLGAVARGHDIATFGRSCNYVCGVDRVPNPEHDAATRRANEAERRMRAAERSLNQAKKRVPLAKQALTAAEKVLTAAELKEKSAQADVNSCKAKKKAGESCSAEEALLDLAKTEKQAAAEREKEAKEGLSQAELDVSHGETDVSNARHDWNRMVRELSSTPTTVQVDRVCVHNYGVESHTFKASSALSLRVHVTGDESPTSLPPKLLQLSFRDETFPAFPGRCEEVAAGDPLKTPTDADIEAALVKQSVDEIRNHVATWYGLYVESYRSEESAARANGKVEDANEAYIRHRLLGPGLAY